MNNTGFTLLELLMVALIMSILVSVAVPQYMKSAERARATEALTNIRAINAAVQAYALGHSGDADTCPASFKKISVSIPGTYNANHTILTTKNFEYRLNGVTLDSERGCYDVAGTDCAGVTAKRLGGTKYDYILWNKDHRCGTTQDGIGSFCYSATGSCEVLESMPNIYKVDLAPYSE